MTSLELTEYVWLFWILETPQGSSELKNIYNFLKKKFGIFLCRHGNMHNLWF